MRSGTIDIFGFRVRNATLREAANSILDRAARGIRENIYFVNAHCVNVAVRNPNYCDVVARANCVFADGAGLALATRVAGLTLRDNVNGTDLFPVLCEKAAEQGVPIAMVGSHLEIVERCAARMISQYPDLKIVLTLDGYFGPNQEGEIIEQINESGAQVLLVALGVPRQEVWIDRVSDQLDVPQVIAVGGLFDFYSGRFMRAPVLIRKLGLEWVVRLLQEPRRLFKRYVFGNPEFLFRTFRLRLRGRSTVRGKLN